MYVAIADVSSYVKIGSALDAEAQVRGNSVDFRVQGAQAVGQLLRQHRDHALREVHRVAAHLGFVVQGHL